MNRVITQPSEEHSSPKDVEFPRIGVAALDDIHREGDAKPLPEVAKKHGVAAAIYAWRKHFGGLEATDVKRLRQLEHENGRLEKLVADLTLAVDILKEVSRNKW